MRIPSALPFLVVLMLAVLVAGCGSSESDPTDGGGDTTSGTLTHVDGAIELGEDSFVLTPKNGDEPITFTFGPAVERAAVRAIATAESNARVTFLPADEPVAAAVAPAPEISEDLEAYEGQVVSISATEIVIDGADGERTFTIAPEDAEAFDVPHLTEHKERNEPVRVYFDPASPDAGVAYEDA